MRCETTTHTAPRVAPTTDERAPRRAPGDVLLHALPLAAMALVFVNNQWWKAAFHNAVTGKLSDIGGLVFFPLFLFAALEVMLGRVLSRRVLVACAAATAIVFSAVQLSELAAAGYGHAVGGALWPVRALVTTIIGGLTPAFHPVRSVADPSDLLTLPALVGALWVGLTRRAA